MRSVSAHDAGAACRCCASALSAAAAVAAAAAHIRRWAALLLSSVLPTDVKIKKNKVKNVTKFKLRLSRVSDTRERMHARPPASHGDSTAASQPQRHPVLLWRVLSGSWIWMRGAAVCSYFSS
jgi:hypothetical protein